MGSEIVVQKASPNTLIEMAIDKQASIETLERLFVLQKDWEANEARKAFVQAMVDFKAEPMQIGKNKLVSFQTTKGITTYTHAELSDVVAVVVPALARHGLSHRWAVDQKETNITVSCILTHCQGHNESVVMTARPDDSGGKNAIQAIASAVTYLQRYTLLSATGMATGGEDDDGRGGYTVEAVDDAEYIEINKKGMAVAAEGYDRLKAWYRDELNEAQRAIASPMMQELIKISKGQSNVE